jgi:CheY-like chemotaxis protein/anti-sigma regulatory factor (Ser/Thr protein kinase)
VKNESIEGLLNAVSAFILELDEQDEILWANDSASELAPDCLGRRVTEAFPFLPEVPENGEEAHIVQEAVHRSNEILWRLKTVILEDRRFLFMEELTNVLLSNEAVRSYIEQLFLLKKQVEEECQQQQAHRQFLLSMHKTLSAYYDALFALSTGGFPIDPAYKRLFSFQLKRYELTLKNLSTLDGDEVLELPTVVVNPRLMIEQIQTLVTPLVTARGLVLTTEVAPGIPKMVYAAATAVELIVLNLLLNAIEATHRGEIHLSIAAEDHRFLVKVEDPGMGFDARSAAQIFDPFYSKKKDHLGLGLTLARRLALRIGGQLDVQSPGSMGTTATLGVPYGDINREVQPQAEEGREERRLILVGESQTIDRIKLDGLIGGRYDLLYYDDGDSLLRGLRERLPDLIIVDVLLPGKSGFDLLDILRGTESWQEIPLVVSSRKIVEIERDYLISYGFDEHLEKPYEEKRVIETIEHLLPRSR